MFFRISNIFHLQCTYNICLICRLSSQKQNIYTPTLACTYTQKPLAKPIIQLWMLTIEHHKTNRNAFFQHLASFFYLAFSFFGARYHWAIVNHCSNNSSSTNIGRKRERKLKKIEKEQKACGWWVPAVWWSIVFIVHEFEHIFYVSSFLLLFVL